MFVVLLTWLGCASPADDTASSPSSGVTPPTETTATSPSSSTIPGSSGTSSTTPPGSTAATGHTGAPPGSTGGTADSALPEFYGEPPTVALAAPEAFAATSRLGHAVGPTDLVDGRPTVMWFYPAAGTGG